MNIAKTAMDSAKTDMDNAKTTMDTIKDEYDNIQNSWSENILLRHRCKNKINDDGNIILISEQTSLKIILTLFKFENNIWVKQNEIEHSSTFDNMNDYYNIDMN